VRGRRRFREREDGATPLAGPSLADFSTSFGQPSLVNLFTSFG
jgi:hypothetical protein